MIQGDWGHVGLPIFLRIALNDSGRRFEHQARAAVFDYIELFYKRNRSHATLNYWSPVMF